MVSGVYHSPDWRIMPLLPFASGYAWSRYLYSSRVRLAHQPDDGMYTLYPLSDHALWPWDVVHDPRASAVEGKKWLRRPAWPKKSALTNPMTAKPRPDAASMVRKALLMIGSETDLRFVVMVVHLFEAQAETTGLWQC